MSDYLLIDVSNHHLWTELRCEDITGSPILLFLALWRECCVYFVIEDRSQVDGRFYFIEDSVLTFFESYTVWIAFWCDKDPIFSICKFIEFLSLFLVYLIFFITVSKYRLIWEHTGPSLHFLWRCKKVDAKFLDMADSRINWLIYCYY